MVVQTVLFHQRDEPVTVEPGDAVILMVFEEDGEYVKPIPGMVKWATTGSARVRFWNDRRKERVTFTPSDYIRSKDMDAFDAYVADLRAVEDYRAELLERYT